MRNRVLGQQEGATDMHRESLVEGILRVLRDRSRRALDPRVGDHHVKAAEPVDCRVHGRFDLFGVGDIRHLPGGPFSQLGRARLEVRLSDARKKNTGTLGDERACRCLPDRTFAAGDQRGLARKSTHAADVTARSPR